MTTPLLSPGGKRRAEKEERNRQKEARAVKRAEDDRKAKEEQGRRDAERAKKEKEEKERKKREEQEKQRKEKEEKEQKERENQEKLARMTDPDAQHRAAMKKAKSDAAALEKTRLTNLKLTNPCLFDTKLKFAITRLLHTNLYEKNNPYRNLFESENIMSWVKFLEMYKTNPLSVYTDEFPYTDRDSNKIAGPDGFPRTTRLIDSRASLLLMFIFMQRNGSKAHHHVTVTPGILKH